MAKFRKKPIEIDAEQFTNDSKSSVYKWAKEIQGNIIPDFNIKGSPIIKIPTNEGVMNCEIGDYLVKEPFPTNDRRLYPCKPDIFHKTYEKVID
jgi:hypothetical protein